VCKSSKSRFEGGTKVKVEGLQNAHHYNGKIANIVKLDTSSNRFLIEIPNDDEDGGQSTKVAVKPQNLKKV